MFPLYVSISVKRREVITMEVRQISGKERERDADEDAECVKGKPRRAGGRRQGGSEMRKTQGRRSC